MIPLACSVPYTTIMPQFTVIHLRLRFSKVASIFHVVAIMYHHLKSVHRFPETQITIGRRAFGKSEKSVQTNVNQHGTLCANNHLFCLMFDAFCGVKIKNHIVDAASMRSLLLVIFDHFLEKHNGTQISPQQQPKSSDQSKIQVQTNK